LNGLESVNDQIDHKLKIEFEYVIRECQNRKYPERGVWSLSMFKFGWIVTCWSSTPSL
jgi:hypothetical protein